METDELAELIAPIPAERLGELLRQRRTARGMSPQEAATSAGLDEGHLTALEQGVAPVRVDEIAMLIQAYGVTPRQLVPPRVAINPALLTGHTSDEILRSYLDLLRTWRREPKTAQLRLRSDDLRILVSILGLEPHEIERRMQEMTGCSAREARRFRSLMLHGVATLPAAALMLGFMTTGHEASQGQQRPAAVRTTEAAAVKAVDKTAPLNLTTVGVLRPSPERAATTRAAGIDTVVVSAAWDRLEPSPNRPNQTYIKILRQQISAFHKAGLRTILDPGLQYPPLWVTRLDASARFVDQYGNHWSGGPGSNIADPVWDTNVRNAQARYLNLLSSAVTGLSFSAVRAGGLINGELRLPSGQGRNSYWAFSAAAQAACPVPGWRPGDPDAAKAAKFLNWYTGSLTQYEVWLVTNLNRLFPSVTAQVLYPSWGLRPGDMDEAVRDRLSGRTFAQRINQVQMGLDWKSQVDALPAGTMVYTTYLDAADRDTTAQGRAPIHYLAELARKAELSGKKKLPLGGESAGNNDQSAMFRAIQRAREFQLSTLVWMNESDLYSGKANVASLTSLSAALGR